MRKKNNNDKNLQRYSMQKITGELIDNSIIIKKPKEVGRLFQKSKFGQPLSGNKLQLNFIEGLFLVSEEKLRVYRKGIEINFKQSIDAKDTVFKTIIIDIFVIKVPT